MVLLQANDQLELNFCILLICQSNLLTAVKLRFSVDIFQFLCPSN